MSVWKSWLKEIKKIVLEFGKAESRNVNVISGENKRGKKKVFMWSLRMRFRSVSFWWMIQFCRACVFFVCVLHSWVFFFREKKTTFFIYLSSQPRSVCTVAFLEHIQTLAKHAYSAPSSRFSFFMWGWSFFLQNMRWLHTLLCVTPPLYPPGLNFKSPLSSPHFSSRFPRSDPFPSLLSFRFCFPVQSVSNLSFVYYDVWVR